MELLTSCPLSCLFHPLHHDLKVLHELATAQYLKITDLTWCAFDIVYTYKKQTQVCSKWDVTLNHTAATRSSSITSHLNEEETVFPATPTSLGHLNTGFTPSSEVINSPFNFEMHSDMIQQLNKSPGDGFLFQSRPMFDHSSMDKEKEQVRRWVALIRLRSNQFRHWYFPCLNFLLKCEA